MTRRPKQLRAQRATDNLWRTLARSRSARLDPLPAGVAALLGTMSDREVAAQAGVSLARIKAARTAAGIAPHRGGRRPRADEPADIPRTVWLTASEAAAHDRARGDQPWPAWIRALGNAAAVTGET